MGPPLHTTVTPPGVAGEENRRPTIADKNTRAGDRLSVAPPLDGVSPAKAECIADKMLAAVRPLLVGHLVSHKNPTFTVDHVIDAGTDRARVVVLTFFGRGVG
jgi:hypothetical protein